MEFHDIDSALEYIRNAVATSMPLIGEEIELIMEEAITSDIYSDHNPTMYDRTGDLLESPTVSHADVDSVEVEYMDNGGWESVYGGHFFPLEGYKSGSVWAPNGEYYSADPTQTAFERCEKEIPDKLKEILRSLGLDVQ